MNTNKNNCVIIIEDDSSLRWVLERKLKQTGFKVITCENTEMASPFLNNDRPLVVVSDIRLPTENGIEFSQRINQKYPKIPVVLMTANTDLDTAVSVYQSGAFDYLPKPFDLDEMIEIVNRAFEHIHSKVKTHPETEPRLSSLIGKAASMQKVFKTIGRLSATQMTVLIRGESGSGKELVAKAIHENSPRAKGKFIAINMAAIPAELVESELFGHEKGAFTGAIEKHAGWFEQADKGTLFLDEIGDMPMSIQTRLLRVLAEGNFYRVGGSKPIATDVRILAATHQPLEQLVEQKIFRKDLYHRLNVVTINLPSLKDRVEDIPLLTNHFMHRIAKEMAVNVKEISPELMQYLSSLIWPGNVRELENLCRWLTVMTPSMLLGIDDLPVEYQHRQQASANWIGQYRSWIQQQLQQNNEIKIRESIHMIEKTLLQTLLKHFDGHRQKTAKVLGWGRNTVTRKIKSYDLDELE